MAKRAYIGINNIARKIKRGYIGIGDSADSITGVSLPSGYTQLSYIQSTGTQYIDTGFKPKYNTRVVMDAEGLGTAKQFLFGTRDSGSSTAALQFVLCRSSATAIRSDYFGTNASLTIADTTGRTIYDKNGANVSLFDSTITNTAVSSGECSYPLYLFTLNNVGAVHTDKASIKLYSCKIYDNGTLVRDYVPCKNASGTVGLYDMVNAVFYTDSAGGTFTAGALPTGSVARKIKKAYIGIGGVARPCWGGGTFTYYGAITPLTTTNANYAAASNGSYAVFFTSYSAQAYDKSLALHSAPEDGNKSSGGSGTGPAATGIGNYAVCCGGNRYSSALYKMRAYDKSLTLAQSQNAISTYSLGAASVGNYALFGGGIGSSGVVATMIAFNSSLTRSSTTNLSLARSLLKAASNGSYALFGGGKNSSDVASAVVDAYNASKTRSIPTALSVARYNLAATHVGKYVLFGGGYDGSSFKTTVDAYDKSLTRTTPTVLSAARDQLAATHIDGYALFGGGRTSTGGGTSKVVDVYDESLTRTIPTGLTTAAYGLCATSVNDFALFPVRTASTDAYTIV